MYVYMSSESARRRMVTCASQTSSICDTSYFHAAHCVKSARKNRWPKVTSPGSKKIAGESLGQPANPRIASAAAMYGHLRPRFLDSTAREGDFFEREFSRRRNWTHSPLDHPDRPHPRYL